MSEETWTKADHEATALECIKAQVGEEHARLSHAHDAANKLYRAASSVVNGWDYEHAERDLGEDGYRQMRALRATLRRLALEVLAQRGTHGILRNMVARAEQAAEQRAAKLATANAFTEDDLTEARAEGRKEAYEVVAEWCRPLLCRANVAQSSSFVLGWGGGRHAALKAVIKFCEKHLQAEQTGSHRG